MAIMRGVKDSSEMFPDKDDMFPEGDAISEGWGGGRPLCSMSSGSFMNGAGSGGMTRNGGTTFISSGTQEVIDSTDHVIARRPYLRRDGWGGLKVS